jgi:hypothetical protein
MKFLPWVFLLIVSCGSEHREQTTQTESLNADSERADAHPRDTVGAGFTADSILDSLSRRKPDEEGGPFDIVTSRGDTLGVKGGWGLEGAIFDLYTWNGTSFLRIRRSISRRADGYSEWTTVLRKPMPPVDSGQSVMVRCQVKDTDDPQVFGTVLTAAHPSSLAHAWRFDTTSMTLSEISAASVKCSQELGRGD